MSPLTLRHSCAGRLADTGTSPARMVRLLGHARAETLRPYVRTG